MRGQARCSVNMMTGVEVATPQLLALGGGGGGEGGMFKKKSITHPPFPYAQ